MAVKHAILGLLSDRPLHGYDLKSAFEDELAPKSQLNFGQVYTTLDRLRRDGLVDHDVVSQAVRPDKKVYALTDRGRDELREWLSTPARHDLDLRNETFLKLMLARRLVDVEPANVIAIERRACMERLHEVGRARARAQADTSVQETLLLELAVLRLEAFAKWLDRCETLLAQEVIK